MENAEKALGLIEKRKSSRRSGVCSTKPETGCRKTSTKT
jgi:hypothetical protein